MGKRIASEAHRQYELGVTSEQDILAAAERIFAKRLERLGTMTDPNTTGQWLRMKLAGEEREHFLVVFLDTRHRIIAASETLFMGTVDGAEVHPRIVCQRALHHNAAACIVAHNHPSGSPEPSAADRAVTARLKQALMTIDVRLLDHFVVSAEGVTSLAARGWV